MPAAPHPPAPAPVPHGHTGSGSSNPGSKPAIKKFIQSPNRSSRNGARINKIVVHCTEFSLASTLNTFKDGSPSGRQVSAHYVIDRNGDVYQMVDDGQRANHCKGANSNSIGIEHVGDISDTLSPAQSKASAALVRWLLLQYDIPPTEVYGHDFTPGYSGGGTTCPDALFGAHTQQSVENWVFTAVLADGAPLAPMPEARPQSGSKLSVTASSLNVRDLPSMDGAVIGSLSSGQQVDWLDISPDRYWAKIQNGALTGWSSRRFLTPVTPAAPAPAAPPDVVSAILNLATTSAIARHHWQGRGVAPLGYIKGMALVYARLYGKLKAGDAAATEMAKANSGQTATDVLAHYSHQFQQAGMDNDSSGISTLRHLMVLMVGLGMRESSGRYCEGRDRAAHNITGPTAEAGLFQTSYNARSAHGLMPGIFQSYQTSHAADPAMGFMDRFKEGVTDRAADWENHGTGAGRTFQELSKKCPAFATEFCALGLRHLRGHWGPINNRAAEIRPEANQLFMRVEQLLETLGVPPV